MTELELAKIRDNINFIEMMMPFYIKWNLYFLFFSSLQILLEYKKILAEMKDK